MYRYYMHFMQFHISMDIDWLNAALKTLQGRGHGDFQHIPLSHRRFGGAYLPDETFAGLPLLSWMGLRALPLWTPWPKGSRNCEELGVKHTPISVGKEMLKPPSRTCSTCSSCWKIYVANACLFLQSRLFARNIGNVAVFQSEAQKRTRAEHVS